MPTWDHVFAMKSSSVKENYNSLWASNFEEFIASSNFNDTKYLLIQENSLNESKIINKLRQQFKLVGTVDIKKFNLNEEISKGNFYLFDKSKTK